MSQVEGTSFSADHTFKVSVNIGFQNPATGQWEGQYDSLYIVMNEIGQVATWKFTK